MGLSTMGLSACLRTDDAGKNSDGVHTYEFAGPPELNQAIRDFVVTCEGPCPQSSGVLLLAEGNKLMSCSFSLVSSQVILTNRHCISAALAKVGTSCEGSVFALFKTSQGVTEVSACDKVLSIPDEYEEARTIQRDYAFLQLKHPVKMVLPRKSGHAFMRLLIV